MAEPTLSVLADTASMLISNHLTKAEAEIARRYNKAALDAITADTPAAMRFPIDCFPSRPKFVVSFSRDKYNSGVCLHVLKDDPVAYDCPEDFWPIYGDSLFSAMKYVDDQTARNIAKLSSAGITTKKSETELTSEQLLCRAALLAVACVPAIPFEYDEDYWPVVRIETGPGLSRSRLNIYIGRSGSFCIGLWRLPQRNCFGKIGGEPEVALVGEDFIPLYGV